MKHSVLLFGGTKDGRLLAKEMLAMGYQVHLVVATNCGKEQVHEKEIGIQVHVGRLLAKEMEELYHELNCNLVVDATHPYATEVSKQIQQAFQGEPCYRLLREAVEYSYGFLVDSIEEAIRRVKQGNILATTGSKEISKYQPLLGEGKRLYARVLPTKESVEACLAAGLEMDQVITKLGASSLEENLEMIEQYQIQAMITKDGGSTGGFLEKVEACKRSNIALFIVRRPKQDEGSNFEDLVKILKENIGYEG